MTKDKLISELIRLIKFFIIGGVGMLINLGLLYAFTEWCGFYYMISAIIAGVINVAINYLANHYWSFSDRNDIHVIKGFIKFNIVMVFYLIVYYGILYLLTEFVFKDFSFYFIKGYLVSSIVATGIATLPKYYLSFAWIWKNEGDIGEKEV